MGIFDILFSNTTTEITSTVSTTEFELFLDNVHPSPIYEVVTTSSEMTSTTQSVYFSMQGKLILGSVLAVCVVLFFLAVAICCYYRKRRVQTQPNIPLTELSVSNISQQVPSANQLTAARENLWKPLTPPRPPAPIPPFVGTPADSSVVLNISSTASVSRAGTSQVSFRKGWCKSSMGKKE